QWEAALSPIATEATTHIQGNGITTAELRNLVLFRLRYLDVPGATFRTIVTPEVVEAVRRGGPRAADQAAVRGPIAEEMAMRSVGPGAALSGGLSLASALWHHDQETLGHASTHVALDTAMGGGTSYLGTLAEARYNMWAAEGLLTM